MRKIIITSVKVNELPPNTIHPEVMKYQMANTAQEFRLQDTIKNEIVDYVMINRINPYTREREQLWLYAPKEVQEALGIIIGEHTDIVLSFYNLPWYKRLWRALRIENC